MVGLWSLETRKKPTQLLGALLLWCLCIPAVGSAYVQPAEEQHLCPPGDYANENGTCCNKCIAGYKFVAPCVAAGHRTTCVPCPDGQFTEQMNFTPNCRGCRSCRVSPLFNMFTKATEISKLCTDDCKDHCVSPVTSRKDMDVSVVVGVCGLVLLGAVGIITYMATKRHTKSKMMKSTATPTEAVSEEATKILIHREEFSYKEDTMALSCTLVCEQELTKLPDCIPLEINIPGLIYAVLNLVPATRVKELVRGLGVTDVEIERAVMDHHTCKEAHYQMLRAWVERESRDGGVGRGGGVLHQPLMQQLLDRLRDMHLGGAAEELETNLSSKATHANNGESSGPAKDEAADQRADQRADQKGDQRGASPETSETDAVDGFPPAAETLLVHRGSADFKHKSHTLGYNRRTKQKVVTDFGTVNKGASKPRAALKQVLFSQSVSDKNPTSEDRLQVEMLKQALKAFLVPADLKWVWEEHSQGTMLESSWTDIVDSHPTMSKMQRHQQEALWEFVHTELTYINKLFVIKDLVIASLDHLRQNGFLQEASITPSLLFSNLDLVLNAHCQFWQEVIYPMLQEVRRTRQPFDPMSLEAGCLQFSERFASYQLYCWEEENTLEFARQQMDTNPNFLVYLKWVENHPQCDRMRLGDMQAKPHQRITKYPLLLNAVLKNTQDPHIQQTIRGMLLSVNGFLETINDYLRFMDEKLALSISAQRIEGYSIPGINEEIDKHVREICHFDLTCPVVGVGQHIVRKLLLEENLKLRGRKDSKLEVVALLFSDVLLITKVQKKAEKLKVFLSPLALDSTCCVMLKDGYSFLLVEVSKLGCAMNVYIFVTATAESCSTWVSTIQQAKVSITILLYLFYTVLSCVFVCGRSIMYLVLFLQDTLKTLREAETSRQLDSQRIQHFDTKPVAEAKKEFPVLNERRVTWTPKRSPASYEASGLPLQNKADHLRSKPKEGLNLFMGKYPEVDYPTTEPVSPPKDHQLSNSSNLKFVFPSIPVGNDGTKRPMEDEALQETWRFPRKLKSPMLRRRRPNYNYQTHGPVPGGLETVWSTPHTNSSSNSDSDSSQKVQENFDQNHTNNDLNPRVLKLGDLKTNPDMFWKLYDSRVSPDPETYSVPELPLEIPGKSKTEENIQHIHKLHANSTSAMLRTDIQQSPWPSSRPHMSPVEGLLERAKVRVRREGGQSGMLFPSTSNADLEVELMRHRVPTVSQGWREQLVDGDAEDKYSHIFVDEVNVDWPGWSFDDDEVNDSIRLTNHSNGDTGMLEDIERTLTTWNIKGIPDATISQV
ncbi:unnamed protein product [Merluccius merluccius]